MPNRSLGHFDLIVMGAGSAGASAAIAAARSGSKVLVIDRLPFVGGTSTAVLDTFYGFYTPGEKAKKIIESFGGKALVRGGNYVTFEGEDFIRTVIWEFENIDVATKCHDSKDYQEAWSYAKNTCIRDLLIVEGV